MDYVILKFILAGISVMCAMIAIYCNSVAISETPKEDDGWRDLARFMSVVYGAMAVLSIVMAWFA